MNALLTGYVEKLFCQTTETRCKKVNTVGLDDKGSAENAIYNFLRIKR